MNYPKTDGAKINCPECGKLIKEVGLDDHMKDAHSILQGKFSEPDWSKECEICGATPVVPITGMCGPCTWGEAETANGNW